MRYQYCNNASVPDLLSHYCGLSSPEDTFESDEEDDDFVNCFMTNIQSYHEDIEKSKSCPDNTYQGHSNSQQGSGMVDGHDFDASTLDEVKEENPEINGD